MTCAFPSLQVLCRATYQLDLQLDAMLCCGPSCQQPEQVIKFIDSGEEGAKCKQATEGHQSSLT
jgi:hypothetical protein